MNEKLYNLLITMDLPDYRLHLNKSNLVWLQKNLKKRNSNHPDYNLANTLVNQCLKTKTYKN